MATFWERAVRSVDPMFSLYNVSLFSVACFCVRVSLKYYLMCVHIIFSSVSVA